MIFSGHWQQALVLLQVRQVALVSFRARIEVSGRERGRRRFRFCRRGCYLTTVGRRRRVDGGRFSARWRSAHRRAPRLSESASRLRTGFRPKALARLAVDFAAWRASVRLAKARDPGFLDGYLAPDETRWRPPERLTRLQRPTRRGERTPGVRLAPAACLLRRRRRLRSAQCRRDRAWDPLRSARCDQGWDWQRRRCAKRRVRERGY
jgi:hypothetical protein